MRQIVLYRVERVDRLFHAFRNLFQDLRSLLFVYVSFEIGNGVFHNGDRLLFCRKRMLCRIFDTEFRRGDEIEHEIVIEILSQESVQFRNGKIRHGVFCERKVISHGEKVRHFKLHGFLEDLFDFP